MLKVITVTGMVRLFSDIIGQVYYKGEIFDIKKGINMVARLIPSKVKPTIMVKDLEEFFNNAPNLSEEEIYSKNFKIWLGVQVASARNVL